jgi:predicted  nucleic acid-binding Zn-ribbon protein
MKEPELDRWRNEATFCREEYQKSKDTLERLKVENSQFSLKVRDLERSLEEARDHQHVLDKVQS